MHVQLATDHESIQCHVPHSLQVLSWTLVQVHFIAMLRIRPYLSRSTNVPSLCGRRALFLMWAVHYRYLNNIIQWPAPGVGGACRYGLFGARLHTIYCTDFFSTCKYKIHQFIYSSKTYSSKFEPYSFLAKMLAARCAFSSRSIFIDSVSCVLSKRVWSKLEQNARLFKFLTLEIATNDNPGAKSVWPRSMAASGKVIPWLLWIVIAHAMVKGNWVRERAWPDFDSQRAVNGIIGTHDGSISGHVVGTSGPIAKSNVNLYIFIKTIPLYHHIH